MATIIEHDVHHTHDASGDSSLAAMVVTIVALLAIVAFALFAFRLFPFNTVPAATDDNGATINIDAEIPTGNGPTPDSMNN